jgi:predicted lipid carrier protein YhbT
VPDSPASTLPDVTVRRVVSSFIQVTVEPLDNVTLFGSKKISLEGEEELGATVRNYVVSNYFGNWQIPTVFNRHSQKILNNLYKECSS